MQNLAGHDEAMVIRYSGLLRGTESAWQALSYGLETLTIFAQHGGVYMNFGLWAIAIVPGWYIVRQFGAAEKGSIEGADSIPEAESREAYTVEQVK